MSQKPQKNHWQKFCEKKLSLENLESRQLLSALPLTANPDFADSTPAYFTTNNDVYVDYSVAEESPVAALSAEVPDDNVVDPAAPVSVTAAANKLNIQFTADANEQYTVVVVGTDNTGAGKDTLDIKNVKADAKKIQDGVFTFSYNGKAGFTYDICVVNGKFSKKEYQAVEGNIPDEIIVGEDSVTTLSPFTFVASPGVATSTSITFQQQNGEAIENLDGWKISAKFDGAKTATVYTVDGDALVCGEEASPYSITLNENGSVTIDGLQLNTKQSFQIAQTSENAESAYSKNLTIATTKEQMAAPEGVQAYSHIIDVEYVDGTIDVYWTGDTGATYTIAYTYTDAKGKVVTKNATTKASVDENGKGEFNVTNLISNMEYTFSVSANKTKDYDASIFVAAEETIITPTTIPAPTLKKVSATDHSVTLQITNWDKMEAALQEYSEDSENAFIEIVDENVNWKTFEGIYCSFSYEGEEGWRLYGGEGSIEITQANNKSTAIITIDGLDANTNYNFQARASSYTVNENINTVAAATSKLLKAATTKEQFAAPEDVTAELNWNSEFPEAYITSPDGNVMVRWTGQENATYTIAYSYTDAKGKVVTKNATTKATVNEDGEGEFLVTKLTGAQKYTFSVSANKTKDFEASEFIVAETDSEDGSTILTPATISAPTLKKLSATDTSVTLQVTNWDKIEEALTTVNEEGNGWGYIYLTTGSSFEDFSAFLFHHDTDDEGNQVWLCDEEDSTMEITTVKNKNTATITIGGLEANTEYSFQATAGNQVVTENFYFVAPATSKALKVKTEVTAYDPVTDLAASDVTDNSMNVSWTGSENATNYIVTAIPTNGGKTVTKTVKGTNVTLTGLASNTDYEVSVVVKADKNGSQSEATTINQRTAEKFELKSVRLVDAATNQYALDFGVDMTQYSGRLDFAVSGSGKVYIPEYKVWASDSIVPTTVSVFYGENAYDLADAYRNDNPEANVLVMDEDGSFQSLNVTCKKYGEFDFDFGFRFVGFENESTLEFDFDAGGYQYQVTGTVQLTGAQITHNTIQDKVLSAKLGKKLSCKFSNT